MARHQFKLKLRYAATLALVAATLITGFCVTIEVLAGASSGSGDGSTGGSCAPSRNLTWWADTCYGASWKSYEADSDYIQIAGSPGGGTKGGVVTGCKTNGGHYYRLALQDYNPKTLEPYIGQQTGLVPVRQIRKWLGLGEGTFKGTGFVVVEGTEDWDKVWAEWDKALKAGLTFQTSWVDTAWFCYSPEPTESKFSSTSSVKIGSQPGVGAPAEQTSAPDGEANISVKTTSENTKVDFWHKIDYDGAAKIPDNYKAPEVSTYWIVSNGREARKEGQQVADNSYRTSGRGANNSGNIGVNSVTVQLQPGETKTVCQNISYGSKTVGFNAASSGDSYEANHKGDMGMSIACATVTRMPSDYVDDCDFTGTCPKGSAEFYSTSTVSIGDIPRKDGSGIDVRAMSDTSDPDGTRGNADDLDSMNQANKDGRRAAWLAFSVDYETDSVDVEFLHHLFYKNNFQFAERDTVDSASTAWTVVGNGSGNGTFTVKSSKQNETSDELNRTTVNVPLIEGETKTVCQTIMYKPKYVSFAVKPDGDHDGRLGHELAHEYFDYQISNPNGSGQSQACVKITRRKRPQGIPTSTGDLDPKGSISSTIMYAGEKASTIGWSELTASGSLSNRLSRFEAIVYLVAPDKNMDASNPLTKGARIYNSGMSPCNYYKGKAQYDWCEVVSTSPSGGMSIYSGKHSAQIAIAVPDLVGYKYCNSAGWFWESWYLRCAKDLGCWWEHNPSGDYWFNYDSACRTIAKKPSVAFWNGGVFASGVIKASASPRYTITNNLSTPHMINSTAPAVGDVTLYGSWSEQLAVANGTISNFASGAALSRGNAYSGGENAISSNYSNLTISNEDSSTRGNAGITSDSAILRSRLKTYLSDRYFVKNQPQRIENVDINPNSTQILTFTSTQNITRDIVVDGVYDSIYQIPKTVIFVDGDVNISTNVKRIDAWIIATGRINTCKTNASQDSAQFRSGSFNMGDRGTTTKTRIGDVGSGNEAPVCEGSLVFNGAVISGGVDLKRTYGSDPETGTQRYTPAEVFNLSADNYMWAYAQAGRYSSSYTEAYSRELAPRY